MKKKRKICSCYPECLNALQMMNIKQLNYNFIQSSHRHCFAGIGVRAHIHIVLVYLNLCIYYYVHSEHIALV